VYYIESGTGRQVTDQSQFLAGHSYTQSTTGQQFQGPSATTSSSGGGSSSPAPVYDYNTGQLLAPGQAQSTYSATTGQAFGGDYQAPGTVAASNSIADLQAALDAATKSYQTRGDGYVTMVNAQKALAAAKSAASTTAATTSSGVNTNNPNDGTLLQPGQTVQVGNTGTYVTQGQVGTTNAPPASTSGVNTNDPNTGAPLQPGQTVQVGNTGTYITQGQVGTTNTPPATTPTTPTTPANPQVVPYDNTQTGQMGDIGTITPAHVITTAADYTHFINPAGALVTLTGQGATSGTLFMMDPVGKQLIPFSSMNSAIAYFTKQNGYPVTAAEINATTSQVPSSMINGYQIDGMMNGFDENGVLANPAPSNAQMQQNYGQQTNTANEQKAMLLVDHMGNLLSSGQPLGSDVTPAEVKSIMSDPTLLGFYVNAIAYGGYTLKDVYQDMVRQQQIVTGNTSSVQNAFPISMSQTATQYKSSANYQSVLSNPTLNVSPTIAGLSTPNSQGGYDMLNSTILQLPDAAFNAISPLTNPNSPEFAAQMAQYKSATLDAALQVANAQNDVQHSRALADWNTMKQEIQDRLGITLSDNAIQAWNQLGNLSQQSSMNNLGGSGLVEQQIDDYLKQQMSVNQSMRSYYQSAQDNQKQQYYQTYASPTEIAALIQSDPQTAAAWGLVPSAAIKSYLTLSNLQALFPNENATKLQGIIDSYIDPGTGNMYSTLYANHALGVLANTQQQQIGEGTSVMQAAQNAAGLALSQYSDPGNSFLKPGDTTMTPVTGITGPGAAPTDATAAAAFAGLNASQVAAANSLGSGSTTPATPAAPATPNPNTSTTPAAPTTSASNPYGFTGDQLTAYNLAVAQIPKTTTTTTTPTTATPTTPTPASYPNLGSGLSINSSGGVSNSAPAPVAPTMSTSAYAPAASSTPSRALTGNTGGGSILSGIGSAIGNAAGAVGNWFSSLHF
jgi:hypothetical protein